MNYKRLNQIGGGGGGENEKKRNFCTDTIWKRGNVRNYIKQDCKFAKEEFLYREKFRNIRI